MDTKPPFDRSIFIPIFIGFFSVFGICLLLLANRLGASRGTVQETETETPKKFQYLGTEPGIVFPTEAPTVTLPPATIVPTSDISFPTVALPTATLRAVSTSPVILTLPVQTKSINTPLSITPTFAPLNVVYDDADFKFLYTGNWISQSGVSDTYLNTLHISNTLGDSVQLSFVGQKIRFAYQAGPSLGTIAIKLDGVDFALDQSSTDTVISEWESPILVLSSHTVTITHVSGGSINIDAIEVIDLSTPTPTVAVSQ